MTTGALNRSGITIPANATGFYTAGVGCIIFIVGSEFRQYELTELQYRRLQNWGGVGSETKGIK